MPHTMAPASLRLPSFDTFLQSSRSTAAVLLPRSATSPLPHLSTMCPSMHTTDTYNTATSGYASPSPSSPSSPTDSYGQFVSLSPTASDYAISRTWSCQSYYEDAYMTPEKLAPAPRKAQPTPPVLRMKKKYLKERQRCEIVRRVHGGERQAHLAKEYGVSRAAVCYLLKHEYDILKRAAVRLQRNA